MLHSALSCILAILLVASASTQIEAGTFPILHSFELPNFGSAGVGFDGEYFWITAGPQQTGQPEFYVLTDTGILVTQTPQGGSSSGWGYRDLAYNGSWMFGSCAQCIDGYDFEAAYVGFFVGPLNPNRALTYDGTYFYTTGFGENLYRLLWDGDWGTTATFEPLGAFPSVNALAHDAERDGLWATTDDPIDNLLFFGEAGTDSFTTLPEYPAIGGCEVAETSLGRVLAVVAPGDPAELVLYDIGSSSTTYVVCPDGSGDFVTIQAAIDAAVSGDIIELCDAVFTDDGNRDLDYLGKELHIRSQSRNPETCVIDCGASMTVHHRGIRFHSGEGPGAILEGITIRNGQMGDETTGGCGGAISIGGPSAPTFVNCVFADCRAALGAAVYCISSSTPTFENCVFEGNTTVAPPGGGSGAGLCAMSTGCTTLTDCRFWGNGAYSGGGIYLGSRGAAEVNGCSFAGNWAAYFGGAIACAGEARLFLIGSTLYDNDASGFGGGLAQWSTVAAVVENTIIAFGAQGGAFDGGQTTCTCCDIYGNVGGDWISGISGQLGLAGNFSADPYFCDAPAGNFELWNYSPCAQQGCGLIGAWPVGCWDLQTADPNGIATALISQSRNHPNPFSRSTSIEFALRNSAAEVNLRIHDATGRRVREIDCGNLEGGEHTVIWNGCNGAGQRVASGMYYYYLHADEALVTRPMVLLPAK